MLALELGGPKQNLLYDINDQGGKNMWIGKGWPSFIKDWLTCGIKESEEE